MLAEASANSTAIHAVFIELPPVNLGRTVSGGVHIRTGAVLFGETVHTNYPQKLYLVNAVEMITVGNRPFP
jgi:hypothetical protein